MWKIETCAPCVCVCVLQLYPSLCEFAHVLSVDGPVKQRLETLAGELAKAADKELQVCCFHIPSQVELGFFISAADWWHLNSSLQPRVPMCAPHVCLLQKSRGI